MSQTFRPRAEEGALAVVLHEEAERVGATLVIGPWRNVTALPMVSLETCLARRRRGHLTRGHLRHLSLPFPAHLSVSFCPAAL